MSQKVKRHEPTPEFRARLEREVIQGLTEARRWPRHEPSRGWQRLRMAAAVLLAVVAGATASMVAAQVQDARERTVLLAAEESELKLASARVELALARFRETRQKADVGIVGRDALAAAEAELRSMEANLERSRLNMQEIDATARAPRNDLAAPLIDGRDFMRARLDLELAAAQHNLTAAENALAVVQQGYALGFTPRLAVLESQMAVARARSSLESLLGKLDIRQRFLEAELSPADAAHQEQQLDLLRQIEVAERLQELAGERLSLLRQMRDVGQVEQVDVLRLELEVAEQDAEIQRIRRSLDLLDSQRQ